MRSIWAWRFARSLLLKARLSSSSSGTEPQRKNERREASEYSSSGTILPGLFGSGWISTRNRKRGEARQVAMACLMPSSKFFAGLLVDLLDDRDQAVDGRVVERLAEGAADEAAHDFPGVAFAGGRVFRRGAVDEDHPVALGQFLLRAIERALEDDALDDEVEFFLAGRRLPCRA